MNDEITTPITITTTDLSDSNFWTQATLYTGKPIQSDNNTHYDYVKSIKYDRLVKAALSFLYVKGYITKEEYKNRESSRLNDIRTYDRDNGGTFVVLFFDESEWNISVEVGSESNIISVVSTIDGEDKTLYQC